MDNKNGAGPGAMEKFFAGKGFYIVLLLCAVVIGVSAWTLLRGRETVKPESLDAYRPAATAPAQEPDEDTEEVIARPPVSASETPKVQPTPAPTPAATPAPTPEAVDTDAAPEGWLWPVYGTLERGHSVDELVYDVTMGDWRTHDGVDLAAAQGAVVMASAAGTVKDIYDDDLYGTTVVIAHGGGYESVYANLAAAPTVEIGETVGAGDTIGSVGDTAICEAGLVYHLHYAMRLDGESVDPGDYLA